jgi:hypothetical protein
MVWNMPNTVLQKQLLADRVSGHPNCCQNTCMHGCNRKRLDWCTREHAAQEASLHIARAQV